MDDRGLGRQREFAVRADEQTVRGGSTRRAHLRTRTPRTRRACRRPGRRSRPTSERETRRRPCRIGGQLGLEIVEDDASHRVDVDQFDIGAFEEVTPASLLDERNRFVDECVELGLLVSGVSDAPGSTESVASSMPRSVVGVVAGRSASPSSSSRLTIACTANASTTAVATTRTPRRNQSEKRLTSCVSSGGFGVGVRPFAHCKPASWATRRAASTTAGPNTDPGLE